MYPIPGSRGYLAGFGPIAQDLTTTGRMTAAGFTSSTAGTAGSPAYAYSAAAGRGMYLSGVYSVLASGSAGVFFAGTEVAPSGAPLQIQHGLQLYSVGSANLGADANDYAGPSSAAIVTRWIITPTGADRTITGIANGAQGVTLWIKNGAAAASGLDIILAHASGSSAAANRINHASGGALTIPPQGLAVIIHDGTDWTGGLFT